MSSPLELAVIARMASTADAARVRAMLTAGKRPSLADSWPPAARLFYAAFESIEPARLTPQPGRPEIIVARWTERASDLWSSVTRPMSAFAHCKAKEIFAAVEHDGEPFYFYRWVQGVVHAIEFSEQESVRLTKLRDPVKAVRSVAWP